MTDNIRAQSASVEPIELTFSKRISGRTGNLDCDDAAFGLPSHFFPAHQTARTKSFGDPIVVVVLERLPQDIRPSLDSIVRQPRAYVQSPIPLVSLKFADHGSTNRFIKAFITNAHCFSFTVLRVPNVHAQ
jgi:hypothetical protein